MKDAAIAEDVSARFVQYCEIDTGSLEAVEEVPSTPGQRELAELLGEQAEDMGYQADLMPFGLRVRTRNDLANRTPIAFGAHLDTSEDAANEGVVVHTHDYKGGDIKLANGAVISPDRFAGLEKYVGDTIFTSTGETLLGGDDKAGLAAIMTFLKLMQVQGTPHGRIDCLFTYDEETGLCGAERVNPNEDTDARYIYVFDNVDGELGTDTFNAAGATLTIPSHEVERFQGYGATIRLNGVAAFPGHGKSKGMIDAFRNLPLVLRTIQEANGIVTRIDGGWGGIDIEAVVPSERDLAFFYVLNDKRFSDGTQAVVHKIGSAQSVFGGYDLSAVAQHILGVPYDISAEQTDGAQGYVQPRNIVTKDGQVVLGTLLRSFQLDELERFKAMVRASTPGVEIEDQYRNMAEALEETPEIVKVAQWAMTQAGVADIRSPHTRGGTESAVYTLAWGLTENGRRIPSVNLGAFGDGYHTELEWASLGGMMRAVKTAQFLRQAAVDGLL